MGPFGRWLRVATLFAALSAGGCAFGKKPYAADPLLNRRTVWGDREKARRVELLSATDPLPPPAPAGPLIGSPDISPPRTLELVTSP